MQTHELGRRRAVKSIVKGKVSTKDQKLFTVGKAAASERVVLVDFGRKVKYQVVKLSVKGLPARTRDGKKITWINNFAIKGPSGRYSKRVRYTVFLPAPRKGGARFIYFYYDRQGLRWNKTPKPHGARPRRPGMLQVSFSRGDPALGEF